jgi:hypothetical protein
VIREGATVAVVARFAGSFAACEPNRAAARAVAPGQGGPKGLAEGGSAFTRGGRPCERRRTETNLFNRVSEIRGPLQPWSRASTRWMLAVSRVGESTG